MLGYKVSKMKYLVLGILIIVSSCSTKNVKEAELSDSITTESKAIEVFNGPCKFESGRIPEDKFPVSEMDKIELVSYSPRLNSYSDLDLIIDDKFKLSYIKQRIALGKPQADSLLSILYNIKPSPIGTDTTGVADCYNPRHSILFYKGSKAIAFFEVCFECGGTRQSKGVDFGLFCPEKLCMLQRFFKANKADFGIIDEMCE